MTQRVFRVLILGDFHFGESYKNAGAKILEHHGYTYSTEHLKPFINSCDKFILNLETPLLGPSVTTPSPLAGRKKYVHWADAKGSGKALQDLGVDAVGLANNHTLDHGPEGLQSTFKALNKFGISWFGAGTNLQEAQDPHRIELPEWIGGGALLFHASFQYSKTHDESYEFYALETAPGCAPISKSQIEYAATFEHTHDSFHIAFPHWGKNYAWHTPGQYEIAHRLLRKGYNLILGHGSHAIQELHRKQQRWVVYGIGNGNFQSGGRWRHFEAISGILPFSFWSIIEITQSEAGNRTIVLKLYPVYSNNSITNFKPHPVSREDFERIITQLSARAPNAWRFDNPSQEARQDDLGPYLHLQLGSWPVGQAPSNLAPLTDAGDPGDLPLRSVSPEVEDAIARLYKGHSLGPALLAFAAERYGGITHWLSANRAVIEVADRRFMVDGYIVHESALGEAICKDKELTARVLSKANVPTPKTQIINSANEAVYLARKFRRPVAIKPTDGNKSKGVTVNLRDPSAIRAAFERAKQFSSRVLIQEHIKMDEEMRILASPNEAVAVNKRILPHVIGDGMSTVSQLIQDKNLQRQLNPSLRNRPIPVDELTLSYLRDNGHSLNEVLSEGQTIIVRNVGGLGVGGDTHQALKDTDAHTKEAAASAIRAIPGLGWGGVDMAIEQGTGRPYVIEINTRAAYGAALFPTYGDPEDVASVVWDLRQSVTPKDVEGVPPALQPRQAPQSLRASRSIRSHEERPVSLGSLLMESLGAQGYHVETLSRRVFEVSSTSFGSRWITTEGFTELDRSVVTQNMRRHGIVRGLLRLRDIPRVRGRRVSPGSHQQIEKILAHWTESVAITPTSAEWGRSATRIIQRASLAENLVGEQSYIVQTYPPGVRVRVCATKYEAFAILAEEGTDPIDATFAAVASHAAVEAIRAVPELRWAIVDIVVQPRLLALDRREKALVEGMSLTPLLDLDQLILAGSIDDFFAWLVSF